MATSLNALVVSDFPIVGVTAQAVLDDQYRVEIRTWQQFLEHVNPHTSLVVVDVTAMDREKALVLVHRAFPMARVVVCSLHQNEVEVYRPDDNGPQREAALPSLLAFSA